METILRYKGSCENPKYLYSCITEICESKIISKFNIHADITTAREFLQEQSL